MRTQITLLLGTRGLLTNDWRALVLVDLMNAFINEIPADKAHTKRAYRSDLNFVLSYLGRKEKVSRLLLGDVSLRELKAFVEHRAEQGDSAATLARRIATLRAFDSFVGARCEAYPYPARSLTPPTLAAARYEGISPDEAEKLIAAAFAVGKDADSRLRNGAAVELALSTGLRVSELLSITEAHMSPCWSWIEHLRCKGGHYRNVYIPSRARVSLFKWANARDRVLRACNVRSTLKCPLFISTYQAVASRPETFRLNVKSFWDVVAQASKAAGLRHVHPHMLRHTRAHEVLESTGDIRLTAQALGHRSLNTTLRYTERSLDQLSAKLEEAQHARHRKHLSSSGT